MYFEVFKQGNLIIRGKHILNTISLDNELMLAPSTSLVLPIDWLDVIDGREEMKIHLDECRVFWGIVWDIEVDKINETIELDVRHVITEWQYRQISVNHAISDNGINGKLNIVYKGDKIPIEAPLVLVVGNTDPEEDDIADDSAADAQHLDMIDSEDWEW